MWSTNHIPAGTACSSLRPTGNSAVAGTGSGSGHCATLWEMSTVPWQKTPGSEAAPWLFHWCCHCSSGECHQPGHSSSSTVTKVTGLWKVTQTGARCHYSSETLRDTIPCSCSAPAFYRCVQIHVLLCEKKLCVNTSWPKQLFLPLSYSAA